MLVFPSPCIVAVPCSLERQKQLSMVTKLCLGDMVVRMHTDMVTPQGWCSMCPACFFDIVNCVCTT